MASMLRQLRGTAIVTGAGGTGIGAAVAKAFVRSGCSQIAITDLNPKTLSDTKKAILSINSKAQVIDRCGDIADEAFVDSFHDHVSKVFSRLDYAVNCAGVLGSETVKAVDMTMDAFDRLNNINYRGSWLSCRAQLRNMLQQQHLETSNKGVQSSISLVNWELSEDLGQVNALSKLMTLLGANQSEAAYCASKAAVINMTQANAIDYAEAGIRVNCVCPGVIRTPMTTSSPAMAEALKPAINIAPLKRMGTPDEVADAVLFLASEQASFILGHALVVDGGYTIN